MKNKALSIFLASLTLINVSHAKTSICENLLGEWSGRWSDLQHTQAATIHFLTIQGQEFSGYFVLENGEQGNLNGACIVQNNNLGYLIFERTPPFYNPCYGDLAGNSLSVQCQQPDQSGQFSKIK